MTPDEDDHIVRTELITFQFDHNSVAAHEGESIAVALMRAGVTQIRKAPSGTPRGMFCVMGVCQECVVMVDGKRVEACRTLVSEGLVVRRVGNV